MYECDLSHIINRLIRLSLCYPMFKIKVKGETAYLHIQYQYSDVRDMMGSVQKLNISGIKIVLVGILK